VPPHLETNLPEGPMPINVKDFGKIELRFAITIAIYKRKFNIEKCKQKNLCLLGVDIDWHWHRLSTDTNKYSFMH
jgi:hypothetical protein